MAKPTHQPDDPEQSKRFIELAEELGADSPEEFERAFAKVAAAKRQPATKPQTKRNKREG